VQRFLSYHGNKEKTKKILSDDVENNTVIATPESSQIINLVHVVTATRIYVISITMQQAKEKLQ